MSFFTGFSYLFRGIGLLNTKGLRRFVILPLLVNVLLFTAVFIWLTDQIDLWQASLYEFLPTWLHWLSELLMPLLMLAMLLAVYFLFTGLANWISAPFNGLLSEQVEAYLTGDTSTQMGMMEFIKDIPRLLLRETQKLLYFLPRFLVFFPLLFIFPVVGQIMWFIFTAWILSIQYSDYPFDNHKVAFSTMRDTLSANKGISLGFGSAVALLTFIPIVNFVVMPAAVCGATIMWVEQYKHSQ